MKGLFIVIEGIDGSGKGTQCRLLANYLFDADKRNMVLLTREPTMITEAGRELRERLASDEDLRQNAEEYTKLFLEDRKEHVRKIIQPALDNGINVVCDRYKYSTIAYQHAQGLDLRYLIDLHNGLRIPDIVFIIDIPAETALKRINMSARRKAELFEKKELMKNVRSCYLELEKHLPEENIIIIDGTLSPQQVQRKIAGKIIELFS